MLVCLLVECGRYLALQEEEHQHADEVSIGAAPPAALGQRLFGLWVVAAEQPARKKGPEGKER